jgi:hypothetical protein
MKTKLLLISFAIIALTAIIILPLACIMSDDSRSRNTELKLVNSSDDTVLVYTTLSGYAGKEKKEFVQDVNGIFGMQQMGLVGSFNLAPNDSVSYISKLKFSGNLSFGTQPLNCPDSIWRQGVNLFEFNVNEPQESIDISCIAGVNCILRADLMGGPNWMATNSFPDVRYMQNDSIYKNTNLVGVFPYGCTNCINTEGKQDCQSPSETPDSTRICNPTRAKNKRGGTIRVNFMGYTN